MSVSRKENGNLVKKAGRVLVDLALSLTSNNAISNAACSEGMRLRNVCEYNGKLYKLNLDGTRGDEIKMGDVSLDFAHPLHVLASSIPSGEPTTQTYGLSYTPTDECYLMGSFDVLAGNNFHTLKIRTINAFVSASNSGSHGSDVVPCTKLNVGDVVTVNYSEPYLHIFKSLN